MSLKPGSKTWIRRVQKLRHEELDQPLKWLYVSFADDAGFRGGVFVQAQGVLDAHTKISLLGINPGGEMLTIEIPPDATLPKKKYRNVLLDKATLELACGLLCNSNGEDI